MEDENRLSAQAGTRDAVPRGPRFSDAYFRELALNPQCPPRKRLAACDRLVRAGRFDRLGPVLDELSSDAEVGRDAARLAKVIERVSGWLHSSAGDTQTADADTDGEITGAALIRRHEAATGTALVFTGWARQVWVSIGLFDRFMRRFPVNVVYLTEDAGLGYLDGIEGIGEDYAATVAGLRELLARLGAPDLYCLGTSSGGDAAMRYGLDLGASRVLAFSPYIGLTRSNLINEALPDMAVGVADLYRRAGCTPEVTVVFGEDSEPDRIASTDFSDLPGIRLHPLAGYGRHDVIPELIATGRLEPLLADLLA